MTSVASVLQLIFPSSLRPSVSTLIGKKGGHNYISIGDNADVDVSQDGTQYVFKTMGFTSKFSVKQSVTFCFKNLNGIVEVVSSCTTY